MYVHRESSEQIRFFFRHANLNSLDVLALAVHTCTKIGTIQRRLAWPLRKDDTQNREAFHIFWQPEYQMTKVYVLYDVIFFNSKGINVILVPNQLYNTDAGSIPRGFVYKIVYAKRQSQ